MKVNSIFDDMPAVISVENGYTVKGYLKGSRGIGEFNPVDGIITLDALLFSTCGERSKITSIFASANPSLNIHPFSTDITAGMSSKILYTVSLSLR